MARIVISYRHSDCGPMAGRLSEALTRRYGRHAVFIDAERIGFGDPFEDVISGEIARAHVVLVLIGPNWIVAAGPEGRRLDDPKDVVRREVEQALREPVDVLPVYVEGARPPAADELPESIRDLAALNGLPVDNATWPEDTRRLGAAVDTVVARRESPRRATARRLWRALVPLRDPVHDGGARRRRIATVAIAAIAGIAALAASGSGFMDSLEAPTVDARYRARPVHRPSDVVVVAIDKKTIDGYDAVHDWPFPHGWHGEVIDRLRKAGARLVVLDLHFDKPKTEPELREDFALLSAIGRTKGVVVGATDSYPTGKVDVLGGDRVLQEFGAEPASGLLPEQSVYRKSDYVQNEVKTIPVVTSAMLDKPVTQADLGEAPFWIDYAGPAGSVAHLSYRDVREGQFGADAVRGKTVVIGVTAEDEGDVHPTPFGGDEMPGPEIQANAIETVLRHAPLRDASPIVQALLTLGLPLLVALGAMRASALGVIALAIGVLVALWILAGLAFRADTVVPVAAPAVAVAVATLGAVALRSRTADGIPALPRSRTEPTGTPS